MKDEPSDTASLHLGRRPSALSRPSGGMERGTPSRPRRRRRTDWRLGGRAVRKWDGRVLAAVGFGGGAGVLLGSLASRLPTPWAPTLSLAALWLGLIGAVIYAFARARPAGLLRFRSQDLLWGAGVAVALRLFQGAAGAADARFPASSTLRSSPGLWFVQEGLPAGLFGPVVEELFFRAVVLVVVYQILRRSIGGVSAAVTSALASAGAFLCLHALFAPLTLEDALDILAVGLGCALLVLLTGRIWGALIAHVTYNVIWLALVYLGTLFA